MTNIFVEMAALLGRSVARRGVLRTAQVGMLRSGSYIRRAIVTAGRPSGALKNLSHPFDRECGTDTGGLLEGAEVATGHPHDRYSVGYYAVAPSVFRETCRRWMQTLPASDSVANYTFVDFGAGKGRALLLASELPFREVIGIEFHEDLARIARENAEKWHRAGRALCPIRVVHQEVTEFRCPRVPLVVFLYNPFGHKVLRQLIAQLPFAAPASAPPVHILYVNPDCSFALDKHPGLSCLWREHIPLSDSDQSADFYSNARELVSAYHCIESPGPTP